MKSVSDIDELSVDNIAKLSSIGITSMERLVLAGSRCKWREKLAKKLGVDVSDLSYWVSQADMCRIDCLKSGWAAILVQLGFESIQSFASESPIDVHSLIHSYIRVQAIDQNGPGLIQVVDWITEARMLTPVIKD